MKFATWNINECVGITCDLNNQKTTDKINIKNVEEIIEKINKYESQVSFSAWYFKFVFSSISLVNDILSSIYVGYS